MANLFKKKSTRPIPPDAEVFDRRGKPCARWRGRDNKVRTAPVVSEGRVRTESATWYVRLRLASGEVAEIPTGCRDKGAAAARMAELVAEQEKIRAGVISQQEANVAAHGQTPLSDVREAYQSSLRARGRTAEHVQKTGRLLEKSQEALGWRILRDMHRQQLERWLESERAKSRGARVCNAHVVAWKSFANWLLQAGKMQSNPFTGIAKFNEATDRRHVRRALTVEELTRVIEAARWRPLQERLNKNRGDEPAKLRPGTRQKLEILGLTRCLAYWTAAATGLRWGELLSISLGAVRLDSDPPYMLLEAKHAKGRKGAQIPLPADLAKELRSFYRRTAIVAPGRFWRAYRDVPCVSR